MKADIHPDYHQVVFVDSTTGYKLCLNRYFVQKPLYRAKAWYNGFFDCFEASALSDDSGFKT